MDCVLDLVKCGNAGMHKCDYAIRQKRMHACDHARLRCNQLPALMVASCSWMRPITRSGTGFWQNVEGSRPASATRSTQQTEFALKAFVYLTLIFRVFQVPNSPRKNTDYSAIFPTRRILPGPQTHSYFLPCGGCVFPYFSHSSSDHSTVLTLFYAGVSFEFLC